MRILVLLLVLLAGCKKPPEAKVEYPVTAQAVQEADIPIYITSFGTLTPPNTVDVKAQVSGQITAVPFKQGDMVHRGDLLVAIDPTLFLADVQRARGSLDAAKANLVYAQASYDSYSKLVEQDFISVLDMANYEKELLDAKGNLLSALADVETAKTNLGYTQIVAPIDGVMGFMNYQVGNIANTQDTLVTLTQVQPLDVLFSLSERDLNKVRSAASVLVQATFLDPSQQPAQGALYALDNEVNINTGTIALKARFDNNDLKLWPGQFTRLRVDLGSIHNALTIPKMAVQYGQNGAYVWVVQSDMTTKSAIITLGVGTDTTVQVLSGLNKGDLVVTDGQLNLFDGAPVSVK